MMRQGAVRLLRHAHFYMKGGLRTFAAFARALGLPRGSCRSYGGRTQKCCIRSNGGREPILPDAAETTNGSEPQETDI